MQQRGDEGSSVLDDLLGPENTEALAAGAGGHSEQSLRRRDALSLYIEQLEESRRSGLDLQEASASVELDGWELDQLGRALEGATSWEALFAEGVAFRNKFETDLGWIPSGRELSSDDAADLRRLLVTDTALGLALLAELQLAVNQLILAGEMEQAKNLTSFRNKIGQTVNELKDRVGDAGYVEAESLSEDLVTPTEQASWTERTGPSAFAPQPKSSRQPAAGPVVFKQATERKNHLKPMLMLLGLLVAYWGVFILPKISYKPLPELSMQDVAPRAEIRHVAAHPPSLYVKLGTSEWNTLSREQRLALIDDVGRTAAAAGYHGAQFTLENGRPAARWLKERGSELID